MPITINGSGTITGVSVGGLPDGIVDTDMIAAGAVTQAKRGAATGTDSGLLQVVQTVKTDTFSTTSTTYEDITGLSVSITPSSSSNKILVLADLATGPASGQFMMLQLVRGSTEIYKGTESKTYIASKVSYNNNSASLQDVSMVFLDSPATTSSVTYKIQVKLTGASTGAINRRVAVDDASLASSITVIEVAS